MKHHKLKKENHDITKKDALFILESAVLSLLMLYCVRHFPFPDRAIFWISTYLLLFFTVVLIYFHYRSSGLATDIMVVLAFIWWIYTGVGFKTRFYVFLSLVIALWMSVGYKLNRKYSLYFAWGGPILWAALSFQPGMYPTRWTHDLVLISVFLMQFVFTQMIYTRPNKRSEKIDIIVSSYSGNTAHFAQLFIDGAKEMGAEVAEHRFHHYESFNPPLQGDSLVIAFPIYGCKPPWPFLYYLTFKLPGAKGKPAFILYTCIGGAENAGILCWLILSLKGYRVMGRNMSVYPLNVPTFRIGPKKFWRFLDALFPRQGDIDFQRRCGRLFALGKTSGIPFIFGLTPAFLLGILIDNKFFDTFLYRNHVMKKRCNQCGICVEICPVGRLKMVNDFPKAKGTCMLCLGCINNCPKNAMHMWFWTEYGIPYKPKYKKLLKIPRVKKQRI